MSTRRKGKIFWGGGSYVECYNWSHQCKKSSHAVCSDCCLGSSSVHLFSIHCKKVAWHRRSARRQRWQFCRQKVYGKRPRDWQRTYRSSSRRCSVSECQFSELQVSGKLMNCSLTRKDTCESSPGRAENKNGQWVLPCYPPSYFLTLPKCQYLIPKAILSKIVFKELFEVIPHNLFIAQILIGYTKRNFPIFID